MSLNDHSYTKLDLANASEYVQALDSISKDRYMSKLKININDRIFQLPDPYSIAKEDWLNDVSLWPSVESLDIVNYVTSNPVCPEMRSQNLKHYRQLEAFQYVQSGKVQTILLHKPENINNIFILLAHVQPLQRSNDDAHKPWVVVHEDGAVETAHCTCLAGLLETCSHVAAVLFKIELAVRHGYTIRGATETTCKWNDTFTKTINPIPLSQINLQNAEWGTPKKKKNNHNIKVTTNASSLSTSETAELRKVMPNAVFFSALTDSETESASESESEQLPKTILEIVPLLKDCSNKKEFLKSLFNDECCEVLETSTIHQASSNLWFQHRKGRITASKFGNVNKRKTLNVKFAEQLMKSIPLTQAMKWGVDKEREACDAYLTYAHTHHSNFKFRKAGLFVLPECPFLGASPDGEISCSCCGRGILEIKCPYAHRNKSPKEIALLRRDFCLDTSSNLKKNHVYYDQIQGQMKLSKTNYCDFVVWTPKDIVIIRERFDVDYWVELHKKLETCFFDCLLPYLETVA